MKKKVGDKVKFTGAEYNITKIFNYEERLKDKELIVEEIVDCPCNDERMDCLKFRGTDVQRQIDAVRELVSQRNLEGKEAPRIVFLRASAAGIKAKGSYGNVGGEMLADLGCINIADDDDSLLDDLSMEAVIAADPDYIFVTTQGKDADAVQRNIEETLLGSPAWNSLSAVKNGRYFLLGKELYNLKPNARWGEAYQKLADILYGSHQ